jgi:hypothetical protein
MMGERLDIFMVRCCILRYLCIYVYVFHQIVGTRSDRNVGGHSQILVLVGGLPRHHHCPIALVSRTVRTAPTNPCPAETCFLEAFICKSALYHRNSAHARLSSNFGSSNGPCAVCASPRSSFLSFESFDSSPQLYIYDVTTVKNTVSIKELAQIANHS